MISTSSSHSRNRRLRRGGLAGLVLWCWSIVAIASDKDDVVEFGGSRLVGEVKYVDRGKLYFKTDTTDTIALDWADVKRLVSKQYIRLMDRSGERYFGSLVEPSAPGHLALQQGDRTREFRFEEIVTVDPIETTVWDRLDIDTSAGYAYTKSTEVEQWSLGLDVEYETEDRSREFMLNTQSTDSAGEPGVLRNAASYQTLKLRRDRWLSGWLSRVESNDALALDYRVTTGFVAGPRYYPQPNQRIRLLAGVGFNNEKFEGNEAQSSVESVFIGTIDWYHFSEPELDLSSTLAVLPSLTEFGRVRSSLNLALRWEIFEDFFWQVSLFDDYDNEAETGDSNNAASSNDYGITTGIGWSY